MVCVFPPGMGSMRVFSRIVCMGGGGSGMFSFSVLWNGFSEVSLEWVPWGAVTGIGSLEGMILDMILMTS